jgi:hypothetical protein
MRLRHLLSASRGAAITDFLLFGQENGLWIERKGRRWKQYD